MQTPTLAEVRARAAAVPAPLARSAALAALALVDPNRGPLRKGLVVGGGAAVAAWAVHDELDPTDDEFVLNDSGRLGWAVAAGAITCALAGPAVRWDARVMRTMRRWRVPAPRVVLAALTFGTAWLSERYRPAGAPIDDEDADDDEGPVEPLDERIEALTRALLSQTDGYGAAELLAQLDAADQHHSDDGTWQQFHVDDDAPRTIMRDYIFPAWGHYTHEGRDITIALAIDDGKLYSLNQWYLVEDDDAPDFGARLPWPEASEVTFGVGTPD